MLKLLKIPFNLGKDIFNRFMFIRYLFSGGTATAIDIVLLFVLTEYFDVYYLAAATFAMTVSFIARFLLQKFVTFQDKDESQSKKQFAEYSVLYAGSLVVTNILLYFLVDHFHMWVVPAQLFTIIFTAGISFLVYKFLIFKKPNPIISTTP